jgi:hypothetical protein
VHERVVVGRPVAGANRVDLAVGSIISVPATGNDIVGAWKP